MNSTANKKPAGYDAGILARAADVLSGIPALKTARPVRAVGSGSLVRRFGTVVCQLRKERKLSGPKFAALAGISKGHLHQIENKGVDISLHTLERIATALGLTPAILMRRCAALNAEMTDANPKKGQSHER